MSRYCNHGNVHGRCPTCADAIPTMIVRFDRAVTPRAIEKFRAGMERTTGPRLNLDRFGMPKDYASYMWVTYKRLVTDDSPLRRAFLSAPSRVGIPDFGQQVSMR